jgi:hypothetical protein
VREPDDLLRLFLESDVQGSVASARDLLDALDRVETGALDRWERTGNAHTLTITPQGAVIEPEFEPEPRELRLSLADLRAALCGWIDWIESRHRPPSGPTMAS